MAVRRLVAAASLLITLFALSTTALGTTYYVATTGSDSGGGTAAAPWLTIQHAVDTIANGDTIIVKDGTYTGARIENSGASNAPKTLRAEHKWGALLNAVHTRSKHNGILEVEVYAGDGNPPAYWVIDGFEVAGAWLHRCIDLRGQSTAVPINHVTIQNCHVHHSQAGAGAQATGIFDGSHSYAQYLNNTTHNNTEHGIYHSNSSQYATIQGNISYLNSGCGFHNNGDLNLGPPGVIQYVTYDKNIAYSNGTSQNGFGAGGAALNLGGESDSVYKNNLLYGNLAGGITLYGGNASQASSNDTFYNNTVVMPATGRYAVLLSDEGGGKAAINNVFFNNIFLSSNPSKGSYTLPSTHPTGFQSDYNLLCNGRFNVDQEATFNNLTFAQWQALGYDAHSKSAAIADLATIFVDPSNADLSKADFHLLATSPAVDAGMTIASVTEDIEGAARPHGNGYDIGAYEYGGVVIPKVATPQFSPAPGTYATMQTVTITCATPGAVIYYTLDGSDPSAASTPYSDPIDVPAAVTIKAIAILANYQNSDVAGGPYIIGTSDTLILQQGTDSYAGWHDTWLNGDTDAPSQINTNYVTDPNGGYHLQWNTPDCQLHQFDISAIPAGVSINSAKLSLMIRTQPTGSPTVSAFIMKTPWVDSQATWTHATSSVTWSGGNGPLADTDYQTPATGVSTAAGGPATWVDINIKPAIDAWRSGTTNNGLMVKLASTGHLVTYTSKWGAIPNRPTATIVYMSGTTYNPAATPAFDPASGSYLSAVDVTLTSSTPSAEVRYTTDGSTPTGTSTLYAGAIHVAATTTIKAKAFAAGFDASPTAAATYTITDTIAAATFTPAAGTYNTNLDITISGTNGAEYRYTTNGSDPNGSSTLYATPVHLTATTTLKAIGMHSGLTNSGITTGVYTIDTQAPSVSNIATVPTRVRQGIDGTITITATADDSSTGNLDIVAAECYTDSSTAPGSGTAMTASDGAFSSPTEAVTGTLNSSSWIAGTKTVYVRARDAAGNWSTAASLVVTVISSVPPAQIADLAVTADNSYTIATATATAFSTLAGKTTDSLTDGAITTFWQSAGTTTAQEEWIELNLGSSTKVGALAMTASPTSKYFPSDFVIEVSTNNADWSTVYQVERFKAAAKQKYIWQFDAVDAQYVRVRGNSVGGTRTTLYYWQIAELEMPTSLATTKATFTWTAVADDGATGQPAALYDIRYSRSPIGDSNFTSATALTGVPAPGTPGSQESATLDLGDLVGRVYVAMKVQDASDNWSPLSNVVTLKVGGYRIINSGPADGYNATAASLPVYSFGAGGMLTSLAMDVASSVTFPQTAVIMPDGTKKITVKQTIAVNASSLKVTAALWKKIKTAATQGDAVYWRIEGKAKVNGVTATLYGPAWGMYFDIGTLSNLAVSGVHTLNGNDALYPALTPLPEFSWTNATKGMVKFYVDISTMSDVDLSDRKDTIVIGGTGILGSSYTATAADWKKIRKLATLALDGTLYWRVRGLDKDKVLDCGSAVKTLIIDSGTWTVSDLDLKAATPVVTWSTDATGLTKYYVQLSLDSSFEAGAKTTLTIPSTGLTGLTYTFTPADITRIKAFAVKNMATTLYYRIKATDADKSFTGYSQSKTTLAP